MATVNFLYRSTKNKAPLNLRLLFRVNHPEYFKIRKRTTTNEKGEKVKTDVKEYFTDHVIQAKTKLEVSKSYWKDEHFKTDFGTTRDIDKLNKIDELKEKQRTIEKELNKITNYVLKSFEEVEPSSVNKDWLQLQIENYYTPEEETKGIPLNLIEYIDFYIDYRKHEIKPNTIQRFRVIQNKIKRYEVHSKKPVLIKEVNEIFKNRFVDYLKSQMYAQNTIARDLTYIKTFCTHARLLGLETHPQLDALKLDKQKIENIYLSFKELETIQKTKNLPNHLDNVRDWLIISCYTGQRISDFMRFTPEMIRIEDGKKLIEFEQKKTGKLMTVPLHKKVMQILEKRNGNFPRAISDQRYNDYIKEVCKEAKINTKVKGSKLIEIEEGSGKFRKQTGNFEKWELVTSHIGRRSFATNFYGQIPTTYLIYITGHSTEAMFLNYIGKSNKDLAMEVSKYF